ncbi:type I-E CRISPR-associated protein Cse1/CasA [Actinomycetaceae bacterium MB13-C1-2]|nr:type I-E CRISPR-associated protein Cse1/CasA [Actinomycetaceae bacterium MB13-C1-2]
MTEEPFSAEVQEFNLIDEDWIPVIDMKGIEREVSIREALLHAEDFRDITGELLTVRFAILRVLLAIIYRAFDEEIDGEPLQYWGELWREGQLPAELIEPYLDDWHHRFDLLSPTEPFMQVPTLRTAKDEWKPVDLIVADVDTDKPLFTMRSELKSLSFSEAARWLIHTNAYDYSGIKSGAVGDERVKGGRGYPMGVGWCGWLGGVALTGKNLRETLLLNYIAGRTVETPDDLPVWEEPVLPDGERNPKDLSHVGAVSLMTWPQRRLRLRAGKDQITGVLVSNGDPLDYTMQWTNEVMSGWRFSQPQTTKAKAVRYMPRTFSAGQALWRGLTTLIPYGESAQLDKKLQEKWNVKDAAQPAAVVEWLAQLTKYKLIPADYVVEVSAVTMEYGAQMSSYTEVVSDRLAFAAALAEITDGGDLLQLAQNAVTRTERGVRALQYLAQDVDRAAGGSGESSGVTASERAYAEFDQSFRGWLLKVKPGCDGEELLDDWTEHVRKTIRKRAEALVAEAPPSAWIGRPDGVSGKVLSVPTAMNKFEKNIYYGLGGNTQKEKDSQNDD